MKASPALVTALIVAMAAVVECNEKVDRCTAKYGKQDASATEEKGKDITGWDAFGQ